MSPTKEPEGGSCREEADSGSARPPLPPAAEVAVGELVSALNRRRVYRDVTLALRCGLRDAAADFSFLRTRGLRSLLKFLGSISSSDEAIRLFCHSQTIPELRVVPVLFQNSLQQSKDNPVVILDHIFGVEPLKIVSPATESEIAIALRVLEGCCLLHSSSAALAHKHKAIEVLVNILSTRGTIEQGACLDALIAVLLESSSNQMDFRECHGIEKVIDLIKDEQVDESISCSVSVILLKCGEFLLLLVGYVNRNENSPLAHIHEDMQRNLGEKCASLVWAASQFGSTLDPEQRQTALHIQARRVVESLVL
ncbi:hypothetical protein ZIOFF_021276 [Zingiber officinale]|uniref:Uncharacterized protein n=1 Tax=Zingiber officinale TaxID=94328 RepID=A0A8J5LGC2_ZINOF|nr:hypothetical protein ZIOFF_021276 [Zingiber officinale]